MIYVALITVQFLMGMTMTDAEKIVIINEILQLRERLQQVTEDQTLSDERKAHLIYTLLPITRDKFRFLYLGKTWSDQEKAWIGPGGDDILGRWDWGFDDVEYNRLEKNLPKKVSPKAIMEKLLSIQPSMILINKSLGPVSIVIWMQNCCLQNQKVNILR